MNWSARDVQPPWLRRFRGLPEKLKLVIIAVLGALIGLVTYELIYLINPFEPRAPTSWLAAFAIGAPRQYSLHRWLTFESDVPYGPRLARAYVLYSAIAALCSTGCWSSNSACPTAWRGWPA
jgi:putative flippase GtrA